MNHIIPEGTDERFIALRRHLPEPSRVETPVYRLFHYKESCYPCRRVIGNIEATLFGPVDGNVEETVFEKRLVRCDGIAFFAWICLRDGKIYF